MLDAPVNLETTMRPDQQKLEAQHESGRKDTQDDLRHRKQPKSASRQDQQAPDDATAHQRVRGQDPNLGRGHH